MCKCQGSSGKELIVMLDANAKHILNVFECISNPVFPRASVIFTMWFDRKRIFPSLHPEIYMWCDGQTAYIYKKSNTVTWLAIQL